MKIRLIHHFHTVICAGASLCSGTESKMIKTAVIGVGNMGSRYASLIQNGRIPGMELSALTRVNDRYRDILMPSIEAGIPVYDSADELLQSFEEGNIILDAVIIATPHYSHEKIAVRALKVGLNVLCDKPSGVYSRQARLMEEAADASGKVFSMIFNQRTLPVYRELKTIISSGSFGAIKRINWVVTDWYRPNKYYTSSSWHATWDKDGGGVLLNQCPHNLDLLQWICGMPAKVSGFCHEGHYHDIEVEDDVTAYMEWNNGATGTFITSTGEAPGLNRLEISLDEALIVCENGSIRIGEVNTEMGCKEAKYREASEDYFKKITGTWTEHTPAASGDAYEEILKAYADEINGTGLSIANGREGRKSLLLSNAIYLSSWEKRMVDIPDIGSEAERAFESSFEEWLRKKSGLNI